ncbi:MAG: cysteine desulfurase [Anaerolineae bacterium]|nr:cysteine desulfurase [Anaerolineae bacterium]
MSERRVYLDHSASTPVEPRVVAAMSPYFSEVYGNPSSIHGYARQAERGVEQARETLARILNCQPREVVFTSCGSESDNLAVRGIAMAARQRGKARPRLVTSPLEHSAVSRTVSQLAALYDCESVFLTMASDGSLSAEALAASLQPGDALVALMLANNEVGTVLPIRELAEMAHENQAAFHTDAVQAAGQLDLDVQALGVDTLAISGHKFYGPKGVGALFVRDGLELVPHMTGGSHEEGRRGGTLNTPLIVGLAEALKIAYEERDWYVQHCANLRDQLIDGILSRVPDAVLTGSHEHRLPSHASFAFQHVNGNQLLMQLDNKGIAASSGSACKTGNPKPSALLMAMGYDESWAFGGLRLSVGRQTTQAEIDYVLDVLPRELEKARKLSAVLMG